MGSICQSKPPQTFIHYSVRLNTYMLLEKPFVQEQFEDDPEAESLSPDFDKDFDKEQTYVQSNFQKSPEQRSQASPTYNDTVLISQYHITSDHFLKFKNQNYADYYTIERLLGVGSYGQVYLVRSKLTNQLRAMKQVKKQQNAVSKKTLREMEILSKLDHPFIIKAFETLQDDNNYNMIIELLQGTDLQEDISNGKFSEEKAAKIMMQLLLAVGYLHNQDVVHRDIKPENILYQYSNGNLWIKLIDFGISTSIKRNKKLSSQLGSMYFMAPEIFQKDYGKQIDIWACGVTLYYMIHKTYPFNGKTDQEMKNAIKAGKLICDKSVSPELKLLLERMLQVNPNKRITAQQALQEDWFIKFNSNLQLHEPLVQKLLNYSSTSLFQELIFSLITYYCQNADENGLAIQTFLCLDKDQDGFISKQEFKATLTNFKIPNSQVDQLYQSLNKQEGDTLTYKEFLAATVAREKIFTRKIQKLCFQLIDYDQDGQISETDFCNLMGRNQVNIWHILNPTDKLFITEEQFYGMFKF